MLSMDDEHEHAFLKDDDVIITIINTHRQMVRHYVEE